jgi:hypothetical protein
MDYLFGRTDKPQGKLYDFKPRIVDNDEMRQFIEMCFDHNFPMSGNLKDMLLQMMKGTRRSAVFGSITSHSPMLPFIKSCRNLARLMI